MQEMTITRNVYRARRAYWHAMHTANIVHWQNQHPDAWRIVRECLKMRRKANYGTG